VLRLVGEQVESLFDEALPIQVRELPEDLARLDALLNDPAPLAPIAEGWEAAARERGRPTIAMALFVGLMVIKQRTGWGYETLVRELSDSLHLRRFCGLSLLDAAALPARSLGVALPETNGEIMLDGKVALVTGAGQGIGRAIAVEMARQRAAAVVVADRSRDTAQETAELGARGGRRVRCHRLRPARPRRDRSHGGARGGAVLARRTAVPALTRTQIDL
jgi:hypothetical protein